MSEMEPLTGSPLQSPTGSDCSHASLASSTSLLCKRKHGDTFTRSKYERMCKRSKRADETELNSLRTQLHEENAFLKNQLLKIQLAERRQALFEKVFHIMVERTINDKTGLCTVLDSFSDSMNMLLRNHGERFQTVIGKRETRFLAEFKRTALKGITLLVETYNNFYIQEERDSFLGYIARIAGTDALWRWNTALDGFIRVFAPTETTRFDVHVQYVIDLRAILSERICNKQTSGEQAPATVVPDATVAGEEEHEEANVVFVTTEQ